MTDITAGSVAPRPASLPPGGAIRHGAEAVRIGTVGADLGRLVWRGQLVTILTLGIYRFWYRTNLRRWYWRNTVVGGDGFSYQGTPRELFIGFLIALAVTLPLYFAGALAALLLASELAGHIATGAGLVVLAVLAQYGAYRARRFRLTRTVWRGLRFDQGGSPWRYAFASLGWALAALLTLGLLFPLFRRAIEAMKVRGTRFGTAAARFDAPARRLMMVWLPIWLLLACVAFATLYWFAAAGLADDEAEIEAFALARGLTWCAAGVLLFCVSWPVYRAAEFRAFTDGSAIGPVTFRSDLKASALFGMYVKFGLVVIALGVVAAMVAFVMLATLFVSVQQRGANGAVGGQAIAMAALLYLAGVYVFMSLKELMLNQPFWRRAAGSVTVSGLDMIGAVTATQGAAEAATGEGLADALDFGGV